MGMTVEIKVNGELIEMFDIRRVEPFDGDHKSYNYVVDYRRMLEHRTAVWPKNYMFTVEHQFGAGSLPLVEACIEKVLG